MSNAVFAGRIKKVPFSPTFPNRIKSFLHIALTCYKRCLYFRRLSLEFSCREVVMGVNFFLNGTYLILLYPSICFLRPASRKTYQVEIRPFFRIKCTHGANLDPESKPKSGHATPFFRTVKTEDAGFPKQSNLPSLQRRQTGYCLRQVKRSLHLIPRGRSKAPALNF